MIHRYAKHIVGAVASAGYSNVPSLTEKGPFKIPNTFEARAALGPVQDLIRDQKIAIIGLGGTGAYVLDLLTKIPIQTIHLLDDDHVEYHTFMRAPTTDEIKSLPQNPLTKVAYYHSKYDSLRANICAHAIRIDNSSTFTNFLSSYPIDFAFVCIDQKQGSGSNRQDIVYEVLSKKKISFIDSGVSITLENNTVKGAVTTSFYTEGSEEWKKTIPNAKINGNMPPGYRNVQLPEVNMLAASLAVMEWRRRTKQYVAKSTSYLHKFRLEGPRIVELQVETD